MMFVCFSQDKTSEWVNTVYGRMQRLLLGLWSSSAAAAFFQINCGSDTGRCKVNQQTRCVVQKTHLPFTYCVILAAKVHVVFT